ncbi:MAG TPA: hypothetical protein VIY52_09995 [Streptosporangiaceae bacterium]
MRTRTHPMTPLAAVAGGLVAGAVGTVCPDTVEHLKYRRKGGKDGPLALARAGAPDDLGEIA